MGSAWECECGNFISAVAEGIVMEAEILFGIVVAIAGLQTFWIDRCIRRGTEDHRAFEKRFEQQNDKIARLEVEIANRLTTVETLLREKQE